MYYVKMIDKRDDSQISTRNFKKNEEKAQKYFNLLKQDALMHKNDYYDIDEEIKYSDIKYELLKDEEVIEYFTIR